MRISTWAIIVAAASAALFLGVAWMASAGGWTHEGALAGARITARWSFAWFLVAWSASALARLWPGGWRSVLLRRRRAVGLAFAANHGIHLIFIVLAVGVFHEPRALPVLIGGGLTYVFIAAMAATSNGWGLRMLGPKGWKVLHTTGGLMILTVFTNSYVGRLTSKPELAIPALSLIGLAVGLKLAAAAKRRLSAQAA
jgi:methionine sulfoxide reductase heme-binding subunit